MIELDPRKFNASSYMGEWYEIAATPHMFAFACTNTRAVYTELGPGTFLVQNSCLGPFRTRSVEAIATSTQDPTEFNVKFKYTPIAKYYVIAWDRNYSFALVGGRHASDLWILSRAPVLDLEIVAELVRIGNLAGYQASKLEFTPWIDVDA